MATYLRNTDDARLVDLVVPLLADAHDSVVDEAGRARLLAGMAGLKERAKDLNELAANSVFYVRDGAQPLNDKAEKLLAGDARAHLANMANTFATLEPWTDDALEAAVREAAEAADVKLGKMAQPLRAALTGSNASPSLFEVMRILGTG